MSELIAKIGADSSALRNDLAASSVVAKKSFKEMKQFSADAGDGIDQLNKNVGGIKKGFNDLKDFMVGGGVIAAVIGFFKMTYDTAKASADVNDKNTAAVVRFGDAVAGEFNRTKDAAVQIVGTFNRIGESIGTNIKRIGSVLTGTTESFDANEKILNETERSLRSVEASLANAKKHAAEFNALSAESKAQTEKRVELEQKALTATEQKSILEQKLLEAQRAEADAGENALARRIAQVAQMKIGNQLFEVEKALSDEAVKNDEKRRSEADARHKIQLDGLDNLDKEAILMQEINDAQGLIASGVLSIKDTEYQRTVLADRQAELLKTQNKIADEGKKIAEATEQLAEKQNEFSSEMLSAQEKYNAAKKEEAKLRAQIAEMPDGLDKIKEETRLLDLQKKSREALKDIASQDKELAGLLLKGKENLNEVEKVRFDILTGVTTQAKLDKELHDLTAKALTGELLPAEKERLATLAGQTTELKKQSQEANSYIDAWTNFQVKVQRTGTAYSGQSTTALTGVRDRLNAQLSGISGSGRTYRDADQIQDYGGWLTGTAYKTELYAVEKELAQRREISQYASRYGEQAAVRQYGDDLAQRALKDLNDTSVKTANALTDINQMLKNSGLFPR